MSFTIFQNEKTLSQAIKTRSSKSPNIDIFPKGLTHGLGLKMAIFFKFFFLAIQARKMSFTIFQSQKSPFQALKTRGSKSRKPDIFPMVLAQKWPFFRLFSFQAIQATKMSLMIFLNEKTPFQAIKTKRSKSLILDIFPKGLTHAFGPKMAIFPIFFLGNIGEENVFYDILEPKNALLGYKNKKFKQF